MVIVSESNTERQQVVGAISAIGDGLLSQEDIERLAGSARIRSFNKGEQLIASGDIPASACILTSGVARAFYVDSAGKEVTDCIAFKPGEVLVPSAGLTTPSPVYVEAVCDLEILQIDIHCVIDMLETSFGLNKLYNRLLLSSWDYHWAIKHVISQERAKDRYLWFLKEFPGMAGVVPARHIASFLGMTPVTLSRLRAELRQEAE